VNRPIVRLYGLVVLLFALLIAFTSRWTIFEASSLRSSPLNARALLEQERIARGPILASNGTVLARSVRGAEGTYRRTYPSGSLFAQTVGYAYTDLTQTGIERYRNTALNGETSATNLQAILDQLQGKRRQGTKFSRRSTERAARRDRGFGRTQRRGGGARPARRGGEGDGLLAEL